jgi:CMP/dCMP kinase
MIAATRPQRIALDGPSGVGKTTVGGAVANQLAYLFVDTGAFYRAVTLAALRAGLTGKSSEAEIAQLATRNTFDLQPHPANFYSIWLNGEDVSKAVREKSVEAEVSAVAAMPSVRNALNQQYRNLAANRTVLMVGRDIGTVVLPDAELKIYLEASLDTRADRRYKQSVEGGGVADLEALHDALARRDAQDSQRAVAPLRPADDAHIIHTDRFSEAEVVAQIMALISAWKPAKG